jgi:DNA-binding phage protein
MRAATARSDCSRRIVSTRLGGGRLRRDHLDLLRVRKDEWEVSEDVLEVMEDDESAQFLRAQRVIARSKRVARVPKRPPARRTELEDAVKAGVEDTADLCSAEWGTERVDSSSAV